MDRYVNDRRIFPISQSQQNIWKLEQRFPHNPMNNICTLIRIKGRIDIALVTKCINHVLDKDLSLRTRMATVDGDLYQYHVAYKEEQFPFYNFSMTDEKGFSRWENMIAQIPMPILDSPLYQFFIYKSDEKSGGILVKIHHLICDGWSIVDLANRLSVAYLAMLSQNHLELPKAPSYERHVYKEREYFDSEAFDKDMEYWNHQIEKFGGERAFLKKNSNANISNAGERCTFKFSELINHAIAAFCQKNRVAPFAIYCIALAIHLKRMSGLDHNCIGVPIINRPEFIDKQTGGMFVNTLPFFFKTDTSLNAEDMIFSLTEQWYDLLRHQRFPFSEISALAGQKDQTNNRLFDIVLSYQDSKIFRGHDTTMLFSGKWLYSGYQNEQLIIHLNSLDGENRFAVEYDYLTQIYSYEDICDLHNHITKILREILLHQNLPVCQLNLLDDAELEKVLYTFNNTKNDYVSSTAAEEFLKIVGKCPGKAALICNDTKISYSDLYQRALKIATHIHSVCHKKNKENIIALCLPRGFDLIASMLAASLLNSAWVILQPELPTLRLLHILKDSDSAMVITLDAYGSCFSDAEIPITLLDRINLDNHNKELPNQPDSKNLAYVVYTSGSTGVPKGVMIQQGSLVNFSKAMDDIFANGAVLSVCNTGFDVFILETICALLCGRTVVLTTDEQSNSPAALAELIKRYAANCFAITPSRLEAYINNPEFAQTISSVESIILGGELISSDFITRLERLTKARIYNQYGASETTIGVSCKCLNQSPSLSAGKPMANCRLYVLDVNLKPLPIGAVGNLYIGGICVGRGYINNEDSTQKNFIEDKFEIGGRMYNSGDLARWEKSGEISILGRCDLQVKLNGHRIEPQEISAVLLSHPDIKQAAVSIVKQENGGLIIAYYTSLSEIREDELYQTCAILLPEYMIPNFFIQVDAIPLTPNGKIDFTKLPKPLEKDNDKKFQFKKTVSKNEQIILDVFKKVLKNGNLSVDSAYFQNGGDSLNSLQTVLEISRLLGEDIIKPADLRRLATPSKLAEKIERNYNSETESRFNNIYQNDFSQSNILPSLKKTYPLTAIQKSILFSSFSDPTGIAYNMPGGFILSFLPDKNSLENAFIKLIAAEDVLRTAFVFEGADAVAEIKDSALFKLESISAQSYGEACKAFVKPFDLTSPPLLRAGIWEQDGKIVLLIDVHHIINDGEGTPILLSKLDKLYSGETLNTSLTFTDYADKLAKNTGGNTEIDYWKKKLAGIKAPLTLLKQPDTHLNNSGKGDLLKEKINSDLSERIDKFCTQNNITVYTFFAAAFGILLSGLSEQSDFVIGTPVAGRVLPETREMLGAFINTLPLRFLIDREKTAAEYLSKVAADITDMLDNTDITQEKLLSAANVNFGEGYKGLYSVMFSMRPDYQQAFVFGGRKITYLPVKTDSVKMDLVLEAVKGEDGYCFSFEYATALFSKETIGQYYNSLILIIGEIIKNPVQKIGNIHKPFCKDKAADVHTPKANKMIDVLADIFAYNNPNCDAIIFDNGRISYDTFRLRSDSIAAQLINCGVKRGDVVAIYCDRTSDFLCGLFGILKCGAAYLPLSPSLPKERINQMLELAGVVTVLCDSCFKEIDGSKYTKLIITDMVLPFKPVLGRDENDIAQVLFTSGSTGQPKGVMISHKAICTRLTDVKKIYEGGGGTDGILCSSSVLFDSLTVEAIIPLALGYSVIMAGETEIMNPRMLAERMNKSNAKVMFSTPSRIKVFLEDDAFCNAVSRLKVMIFGGEVFSDSLGKRLMSVCSGDIYNLYGPMETTAFVTGWKLNGEKVTIGYPLANTQVYILDENMCKSMPTECGEIYIGGDCLAKGYIGRPDLTKAAFLDNPFAAGEKLYRTGDMARMLSDGRIEYLGRRDQQVKLNGQRIELEEISIAIINTGMASGAATIINSSEYGQSNDRLKAFVVPKEKTFDENALRSALKKTLPQYMIPAEIAPIAVLPLTATGKTDIQALKAYKNHMPPDGIVDTDNRSIINNLENKEILPHIPDKETAKQTANDRETVRAVLIEQWKEVLAKSEIDCDRSFFEQGGTSLSCMNLLIRYFKYGWEIKLGVFYDKPTLNQQLDYILSVQANSPKAQNLTQPENNHNTSAVLVTGAAGFLGAHIVYELINLSNCKIYCLVRGGRQRLFDALKYYFPEQWINDNQTRIVPINGDICAVDLGVEAEKYSELINKVRTVYHCAADVRHYMDEGTANRANVGGTKNVILFCEKAKAYLAFVSTLSVGAEKIERESRHLYPDVKEALFDESCFDIGQNWRDNVYVRSKFLAEAEIQKAIKNGLKAKILRIGRLVGRSSDGKFQPNKESNYFYNVITGIARIGAVPSQVYNTPLELTPVDSCAKAAIIVTKDGESGVAHLSNPYLVTIGEVAEELTNGKIKQVGLDEYKNLILSGSSALTEPLQTMQNASILNSSLALDTDGFIMVKIINDKTNERLRQAGFLWPKPNIQLLLKDFKKE